MQLDFGTQARRIIDTTGVRITVGSLPPGTNAAYRARNNTIAVSRRVLSEDARAIAALLAHELTHAEQSAAGQVGPATCVANEVQAYINEAAAWSNFVLRDNLRPPWPTALQRHLWDLVITSAAEGEPGFYKLVVDEGGYQAQCSLWVP